MCYMVVHSVRVSVTILDDKPELYLSCLCLAIAFSLQFVPTELYRPVLLHRTLRTSPVLRAALKHLIVSRGVSVVDISKDYLISALVFVTHNLRRQNLPAKRLSLYEVISYVV